MNFTLFGYSKTGKTTLFNLLTGAGLEVHGYEDGKREPNLRTCSVPDPRLDRVSSLFPDRERKPAMIDYTDLAGLSFGEIRQAAYIDHLRRADGLAHVVRGFDEESIPPPRDRIDPAADVRSMEEELLLTDMIAVESRLEKLEQEMRGRRTPEGEREQALMERLRKELEEGRPLRGIELNPPDDRLCRSFAFLSRKPLLHLVNVDETDIEKIREPEAFLPPAAPGTAHLAFCGKIEAEIQELDEPEKSVFMKEYRIEELSAPRFLKTSYDLLDLITFFTIGRGEVKAWTIPRGMAARDAAGEIHTDIRKGFIRAEVISWERILEHGTFPAAREAGAVSLEGRDYPVADGDVIFFRFSK